jgi:hypothetical protein
MKIRRVTLLSVLFLSLGLASTSSCGLLKSVITLVPGLLDTVGNILASSDYQSQLDNEASRVGEDQVAEAVREVMVNLTINQPVPSLVNIHAQEELDLHLVQKDRAELWLRRRGKHVR